MLALSREGRGCETSIGGVDRMMLSIRPSASAHGWGLSGRQAMYNVLKAFEQLSSGERINSAADDPAGLVISEQLRGSIGSLSAQMKNYEMIGHKYETASYAVAEQQTRLHDLRALALSASNEGFNDSAVQQAYAGEAASIVATYNTATSTASYNNQKLFDGSTGAVGTISTLDGIDLSTPAGAEAAIVRIEEAQSELNTLQIEIGSKARYEFDSQLRSLDVARENMIAAESMLRDVDYGEAYSSLVGNMIKLKGLTAMMTFQKMEQKAWASLLD